MVQDERAHVEIPSYISAQKTKEVKLNIVELKLYKLKRHMSVCRHNTFTSNEASRRVNNCFHRLDCHVYTIALRSTILRQAEFR